MPLCGTWRDVAKGIAGSWVRCSTSLVARKSAIPGMASLARADQSPGNINQVLKVDSVVCDFNAYPYRAVTYATQKIIRQSNVTERSLVTTCRLLNASRSDDNPNGFTIEGFTIIENKDLQTIKR